VQLSELQVRHYRIDQPFGKEMYWRAMTSIESVVDLSGAIQVIDYNYIDVRGINVVLLLMVF